MPKLDAFAEAELQSLPSPLLDLIQDAPMPDLDAGPQDADFAARVEALTEADFGDLSRSQRELCLSGLWLLAGELDRSHDFSQSIDSAEGSFWHGIMHRREGDFGNAKYWFRRVGSHSVLDRLSELAEDYQDAFDFVDQCQHAVRDESSARENCKLTQWLEWQALLAHCIAP